MKNILAVSHCILNNASKVAQDESGLAEEYKQRDRLISAVMDKGVQLIQLPCPEFMVYGAKRWGHVKDQFDNPFYRSECRRLLEPVLMQLREYSNCPERFRILGVVSVEGSPSCGAKLTCRGDWGGELCDGNAAELISSVRTEEAPGVFIEELSAMMDSCGLDIALMSISEAADMIEKL